MDAARELLSEVEIDQISLPAIAERAGIPSSSAYHFYPETTQLYKELATAIACEMIDSGEELSAGEDWQQIVSHFLRASSSFFNRDAAARQLMLGPKTAPEIKHAACREDYRFGEYLLAQVGRQFELPPLDNGRVIFFKAVQVADLMFSLSVFDHGRVTEEALGEAEAATIAYLGLYLPRILRKRSAPATKRLVSALVPPQRKRGA